MFAKPPTPMIPIRTFPDGEGTFDPVCESEPNVNVELEIKTLLLSEIRSDDRGNQFSEKAMVGLKYETRFIASLEFLLGGMTQR